eukprot:4488203-Lingulodinium_polyedra.AAC.1
MNVVQVRNEIRLLNQPRWFQTYFHDVFVNGGMAFCKFLSTPERHGDRQHRRSKPLAAEQLTPAAKRQQISE